MSINLRKAQKHMQRARELLNPESQLGFGGYAGDNLPSSERKGGLDPQQSFQTDEQLDEKIREHVAKGDYTALQNMIDIGEHSSEYRKSTFAQMHTCKSDEDLKRFMRKRLNSKRVIKMIDATVKRDALEESLFLALAKKKVKTKIEAELDKKAEGLIKSTLPISVDELQQMILARGIFETVAVRFIWKLKHDMHNKWADKTLVSGEHHNLCRKKVNLMNLNEMYKQRNDMAKESKKRRRQQREEDGESDLEGAFTESDSEVHVPKEGDPRFIDWESMKSET